MAAKSTFECNDLREIDDYYYVRRAPFGTPNYRCGMTIVKYKKDNWTSLDTGKTCPTSGFKIWRLTAK